jgi:hypothetical protein
MSKDKQLRRMLRQARRSARRVEQHMAGKQCAVDARAVRLALRQKRAYAQSTLEAQGF